MNPADLLTLQRALEVLQRQSLAENPGPTVAELYAPYDAWYKSCRKSYRSAFIPRWRQLLPYFEAMHASQVTLVHVDAYRASRVKAAPATRNCEVAALRSCFIWAVKRRLIPTNPIVAMDKEPARNQRTAFLDEQGFARLAAAAPNPMARALFVVAFDTGMRRGELIGLRRDAVDLEARLIRLGDADCKNGEGRIVPLTDRAVDVIRSLPAWSAYTFSMTGGPVARSSVHEWFAFAREKAGLPAAMTFHGLRHSAATLMRRRGVPWPLIKVALGWKTDVAARRYQQYGDDDWASLRERMNGGIATEGRKPPLKSVPAIPESLPTVGNKAQATTEK